MSITITIPGRVDTHHRPRASIQGGKIHTRKAASYRAYMARVAWLARSPFAGWPLTARYAVTVTVHEHDRRSRDLDNVCKGVIDGLTGIAWSDDKQIDRLLIVRGEVRKSAPCVVVEVADAAERTGPIFAGALRAISAGGAPVLPAGTIVEYGEDAL